MQKLSALGTFAFELSVPFPALCPPPARLARIILLIFFRGPIFATGNYSFLSILNMVLAVPPFDDRQFPLEGTYLAVPVAMAGDAVTVLVTTIFALFLCRNICRLAMLFHRPHWLSRLLAVPSTLMISNPYVLFAMMITNRNEIVIEGNHGRKAWLPSEIRWELGDPKRHTSGGSAPAKAQLAGLVCCP
jgi:hypothetical protein